MEIPISTILIPIISKLVALQSFFLGRPRIDVDLVLDPNGIYGQKYLGRSRKRNHSEPIPIFDAVYDFESHWDYTELEILLEIIKNVNIAI